MSEATNRIIDEARRRVPEWVKWIAVDECGTVWGYEFKPSWSTLGFWFCYGTGNAHLVFAERTAITGSKESIWAI